MGTGTQIQLQDFTMLPAGEGPVPIQLRHVEYLAARMRDHWMHLMARPENLRAWYDAMAKHLTILRDAIPPIVAVGGKIRPQSAVTSLQSARRLLDLHRSFFESCSADLAAQGHDSIPLCTGGSFIAALTPPRTPQRLSSDWGPRLAGIAAACALNRLRLQVIAKTSTEIGEHRHVAMYDIFASEQLMIERALNALVMSHVGHNGYGYYPENAWSKRSIILHARYNLEDTLYYAGIFTEAQCSVSTVDADTHSDLELYRVVLPHGGFEFAPVDMCPRAAPPNGTPVWTHSVEHGSFISGRLVGHLSYPDQPGAVWRTRWLVDYGAPVETRGYASYQVQAVQTADLMLRDPREQDPFSSIDVARLYDLLPSRPASVSSLIGQARQAGWSPKIVEPEYLRDPERYILNLITSNKPQRTSGAV